MPSVEYLGRKYEAGVDAGGRVWVRHPLTGAVCVDPSGVDIREFNDDGATFLVCALNIVRGYQWDLL